MPVNRKVVYKRIFIDEDFKKQQAMFLLGNEENLFLETLTDKDPVPQHIIDRDDESSDDCLDYYDKNTIDKLITCNSE